MTTSRHKTASKFILIDGSVKIQEAPEMKKVFSVTLVKPTSTERTNLETEYDKKTNSLNFIFKTITYTVKFIGNLDKSTDAYGMSFMLQEV